MENDFLGFPLQIKRRAFYRQIRLQIQLNGLIQITAGKMLSQKRIQNFLIKNQQWIERVQTENQQIRQRYPQKKFVEGERFPYLGVELPLHFTFSGGKWLKFEFTTSQLVCYQPGGRNFYNNDFRVALLKCYEKAGKKWLLHRLKYWGDLMSLAPTRVSVRSQKTRWGSCSSEGAISLNWRLLAAPLPVMDYVVIHELAHLVHQNHGEEFWQLVAGYDSHFKYNRGWLKTNQWAFDFLAKSSELY